MLSEFSKRFKYLREARGMTQDKASEVLGISRSTVAGYESEGKSRVPREETLTKIADLFGTTTDYLLGRSDEPFIKSTETDRHPGEKLRDYIEQGLTNEQIKKRADLFVAFLSLNDKQSDEFLDFARDQLSKNSKQSSAALSKSQEP